MTSVSLVLVLSFYFSWMHVVELHTAVLSACYSSDSPLGYGALGMGWSSRETEPGAEIHPQ